MGLADRLLRASFAITCAVLAVATLPEPQTAIKDLGGRLALAALFWIISSRIRSQACRANVNYRYLFMHPSGAELAELGGLIEQGKLKVIIDGIFSFEKMPEALAYVESGHAKGKVVVAIRL